MVSSASTVHFMSDAPWPPPAPPSQGSAPSLSSVVTPVGNWTRLWASILDGILMIVTLGIGWLVWSVYLLNQSTSPAKKMLGLQIVDVNTGVPATLQQMLLREVLGKVILSSVSGGITSLVSAVMILVLPNRQGLHDFVARTTVTRRP